MLSMSVPNTAGSESEILDSYLTGIAAGSKDCLAQLYDRTRAGVYGLALSYLKNSADAEDVMQDTYVQVWNCASNFRPQGHPMAWLLTVARNLCLARLRQQTRFGDMSQEEWQQIPEREPAVSMEDRTVLELVLSQLSAEESRIVILHAVAGLKHREIARLMELPLATVLSKYHRALKKLKKKMEGEEMQ